MVIRGIFAKVQPLFVISVMEWGIFLWARGSSKFLGESAGLLAWVTLAIYGGCVIRVLISRVEVKNGCVVYSGMLSGWSVPVGEICCIGVSESGGLRIAAGAPTAHTVGVQRKDGKVFKASHAGFLSYERAKQSCRGLAIQVGCKFFDDGYLE